jgi:O-antigen/teichoic acid export membrane protein
VNEAVPGTEVTGRPRVGLALGGFRLKVLQVAGGTAMAQALLVVASPLLTRIYTPADFGVLGVYLSIVSVLVIIASLRLEMALPIPTEAGEADALLAVCLLLVAGTCMLSALLIWICQDRILRWMGAPALGPYLWLIPVSILGAGLYQVFNCWAIRKQGFARIARTKITQGVTQILVQVAGGLCLPGPIGLLVGDAVGRSNGSRTLAMLDWKNDWAALRLVTWRRMWQATVRYRAFPLVFSGAALMNTVNLRLPSLLLAIYFGPAVAGCFVLAQRVFGIPSTVLGESVTQVYFAEFAGIPRSDSRAMMALFKGTIKRMFLMGLPIMILASVSGWVLFPMVFGRAWKDAGIYLVAISPMALAQLTSACVSSTLVVLERQDLTFYREVLRSVLLLGGIFAAYYLKWSPRAAVILFGITGTLAYGVYAWVTWYAIYALAKLQEAGL